MVLHLVIYLFLIPIVEKYLKATNDTNFLRNHISTLEKEYKFWLENMKMIIAGSVVGLLVLGFIYWKFFMAPPPPAYPPPGAYPPPPPPPAPAAPAGDSGGGGGGGEEAGGGGGDGGGGDESGGGGGDESGGGGE